MSNPIVSSPQTKYVSIVAENGEQFNAGQKVIYNIEPSIGYIKKDSYLVLDVANITGDNGRCFFGNAGAHSIIDNINIYAKDTGVLLESIQNYPEWCAIENQYLYDDKTQLNIKEGVALPCKINKQEFNANNVLISREVLDPTFIGNNGLCSVSTTGLAYNLTKRYCIPLRTGIFRHWGDDKLIPILNFGGLRIELNLAQHDAVLQQMGCASTPVNDHWSGRVVRDINASNTPPADETYGAVCINRTTVSAAASFDTSVQGAGGHTAGTYTEVSTTSNGAGTGLVIDVTVQADGTINALGGAGAPTLFFGGSGYVVGETITIDCIANGLGGADDYTFNIAALNTDLDTQFEISDTTMATCGFCIGNELVIKDSNNLNAAPITGRKIIAMSTNGTNVRVDTDGAIIPSGTDVRLRKVTTGNGTPKYQVKNTEMRLCQVIPTNAMKEQLTKSLDYEFMSYDVFLDNIPTASLRHQIPINSVASKSKAIFTSLHLPSLEKNATQLGSQTGSIPTDSKVNEVVFFINNRLYPLRAYNPNIKNDKVLAMNEMVKAFRSIGKEPMSLGLNKGQDCNDYNQTFLLCRELARNQYVFDLRNAEPEIRLGFSTARAEVLRSQSFVFSNKIIQATATGVQVVL